MAQPAPVDITFEGPPPFPPQPHVPTPPAYLACAHLSQTWVRSYDTKNRSLLSTITTPALHIDYTSVMGPSDYFPSMSACAYASMMSNPSTLGHPLVATQHFLGFPTFIRTSPDTITGTFQVRAHHVRFSSDGQGDKEGYAKGWGRRVLAVATGHSVIQHFYQRDGEGGS